MFCPDIWGTRRKPPCTVEYVRAQHLLPAGQNSCGRERTDSEDQSMPFIVFYFSSLLLTTLGHFSRVYSQGVSATCPWVRVLADCSNLHKPLAMVGFMGQFKLLEFRGRPPKRNHYVYCA